MKLGIAYELYSMAASASLRDAHDSKCYLEEIVLNDKPNEKNFWKKMGKCDEVVVFHSEHHEGKLIKRPDKKGGKSGKKGESRRHDLPKPLKVIYKAYKRIFKWIIVKLGTTDLRSNNCASAVMICGSAMMLYIATHRMWFPMSGGDWCRRDGFGYLFELLIFICCNTKLIENDF